MLPHHCVRKSYDSVAEEYATGFRDELAGKPLDRALLASLAEQVGDGAPIADLGCGPGHTAAWLADQGVAPVGIDLSPAMIAVGRVTTRTWSSGRGISLRARTDSGSCTNPRHRLTRSAETAWRGPAARSRSAVASKPTPRIPHCGADSVTRASMPPRSYHSCSVAAQSPLPPRYSSCSTSSLTSGPAGTPSGDSSGAGSASGIAASGSSVSVTGRPPPSGPPALT